MIYPENEGKASHSPPPAPREGFSGLFNWIGADSKKGLYTLVRVLRYDRVKKENYPIKSFWTDRPISVINPDKVYFYSPALRRYNSVRISCSRVVWLDFDFPYEDSLRFHINPSLVVSTGNGFHVYWKVNELIYPEEIKQLLDRLIKIYPNSDKLVSDATRMLRVPGSYNQKFDPPFLTKVMAFSNSIYTIGALYG
jgi:hypothetical protein